MAQAILRSTAVVLFGLQVRNRMDATLEENYIFTSNHKAYVDPPFVGSTFPREAHFIAKASLFRNPLFGGMIRFFNAFPIKRGVFDREAMAYSLDLLERGESMLIFIEGGRVEGPELGETRSGVGYLALQSGIPVIPVYARGTDRLMACLLRKTRLVVSHGRPVRIPPELQKDLLGGNDREAYRVYSEMIMAAIQALKDEVDGDQ
jgi:1-acyl-sn-glycerol-3-phosphate acyltransferase